MYQDYGFDYSDGDEAEEGGAPDLENMYYTAKCERECRCNIQRCLKLSSALKDDTPEEALVAFRKIVTTEENKGDWYAV